jgi:hypothetical protein
VDSGVLRKIFIGGGSNSRRRRNKQGRRNQPGGRMHGRLFLKYGNNEISPQKIQAKSDSCEELKSAKTARANRKPQDALKPSGKGIATPSGKLGEKIRSLEIGEIGVVRSLKDRPPDWLHYRLQNSVGDFAPENSGEGFPKIIRWKVVAGPPVSPLQDHDLIVDEQDIRERFPKQPTEQDIRGIRSTAGRDFGERREGVLSDWSPAGAPLPDVPDDLAIPDFLRV